MAAALVVGLCAACVMPGPLAPAAPAEPPPAVAPPSSSPALSPPAAAAVLSLPKPEAKAHALKLAMDALELLQNGEELAARGVLDNALRHDPANEIARKLVDQIRADAVQELGAVNFPYTVQPGDTLAKIAQAHLGDRYRFYILAKYNGIGNPSRLLVGQVIKIPGQTGPLKLVNAGPQKAPAPELHAVPTPEQQTSPKRKDAERLYSEGLAHQKSGNIERAYAAFSGAASRDPSHEQAVQHRDVAKRELIGRYHKDASAAFHRQDLDGAIQKWDQVLILDPDNEVARLKRAQALDLKQKIEKFGK